MTCAYSLIYKTGGDKSKPEQEYIVISKIFVKIEESYLNDK